MLKEKSKLLTIGQFAALHDINKKTLMWYDQVGLLKPVCIQENGYRYYSHHQSTVLETILMLRELNVSIPEIQDFLQYRTLETFDALLTEKIGEVEQTIAHLHSVRQILFRHRQDVDTLRTLDLSGICLVERESRCLVAVDVRGDLPFHEEVERVIGETKKYQLRRLHDAAYGSILPVESLYQGNFTDYTALYIELPFPIPQEGLHHRRAGTYLRAFCKGSWERLPERYREILAYAQAQGLTLEGCAYETGINELVIDNIEDYITQIEIVNAQSSVP